MGHWRTKYSDLNGELTYWRRERAIYILRNRGLYELERGRHIGGVRE